MAKKYVIIRMPRDTYNKFKRRKVNLSKALSKLKNKPIKIPMTKFFDFQASQESIYPEDFGFYLRKKRRRGI